MPKYSRWDDRITFSSLDIAALINKDHKHVKRDIRLIMTNNCVKELEKYKGVYLDKYKRKQSMYLLNTDLIKLLKQHYQRRSPEVSNLIAEHMLTVYKAHNEDIERKVNKFFEIWEPRCK
ncbi:Rha family transcriptional regulator [Acinetobacter gerneri]|uniref:Rha family transcriptional regulator n=1 Tax=Acinetobacter gerneri TaxID=202952 RepID=UPI003A86B377